MEFQNYNFTENITNIPKLGITERLVMFCVNTSITLKVFNTLVLISFFGSIRPTGEISQ